MNNQFKNICLIINPEAKGGRAREEGVRARHLLENVMRGSAINMVNTQNAKHAEVIFDKIEQPDLVIALGGDGLVHEVVNGIMAMPEARRPVLAVIPYGSGNDFARSLGFSFKVEQAVAQLSRAEIKNIDLGICNGRYFVQSLSFGLDAQIAQETNRLRRINSASGTRLYLQASLNTIKDSLGVYNFSLSPQCEKETLIQDDKMHLMAIQNGKTYGGGFKICPDAKLDDGLLSIAVARAPLSKVKATCILLLARFGLHTQSKGLDFFNASYVNIKFPKAPVCQMDGELHEIQEACVSVIPKALKVLAMK